MPAGNAADRIGHRQHGQAEGERDADEADAEFRKGGGENGAAAAAEHQPERTEKFGEKSLGHGPS